jgi:hypothetical protein
MSQQEAKPACEEMYERRTNQKVKGNESPRKWRFMIIIRLLTWEDEGGDVSGKCPPVSSTTRRTASKEPAMRNHKS